MAKYNWHPIEEMDLDEGTHTCYATTDHDGRFIWLTQISDDTWDVEIATKAGDSTTFYTMMNCKTLTSAKRWVSQYWFRHSRLFAERYPAS